MLCCSRASQAGSARAHSHCELDGFGVPAQPSHEGQFDGVLDRRLRVGDFRCVLAVSCPVLDRKHALAWRNCYSILDTTSEQSLGCKRGLVLERTLEHDPPDEQARRSSAPDDAVTA